AFVHRDPVASGGRAVTGSRIGVVVGHRWTFLFPDIRGGPGSGARGSRLIWWSRIMAASVQSASFCEAAHSSFMPPCLQIPQYPCGLLAQRPPGADQAEGNG